MVPLSHVLISPNTAVALSKEFKISSVILREWVLTLSGSLPFHKTMAMTTMATQHLIGTKSIHILETSKTSKT